MIQFRPNNECKKKKERKEKKDRKNRNTYINVKFDNPQSKSTVN